MKSFLIWLLLCLIWGTTWIAIKIGLADVPPFGFAALRFVIAASVLAIILKIAFPGRSLIPRGKAAWMALVVTGLLSFTLNYAAVFWGEQYITAGLAALLSATNGIWMLIFLHYKLREERLTLPKLLGALAALAGVALIFMNELRIENRQALYGCCALLIAAAGSAYGGVATKQARLTIFPPAIALWQMIFGCLPLLLLAFTTEGNPLALAWTPRAVAALLYLAIIGSALSFSLFYALLQSGGAQRLTTISLVVPLVSVIVDRLALSESLTLRQACGGALIMLGAGLVIRNKSNKTIT